MHNRVEYELWGGGGAFADDVCPAGRQRAVPVHTRGALKPKTLAIGCGRRRHRGQFGTPAGDSSINGTVLVAGGGVNGSNGNYAGPGGVMSGTLTNKILLNGGNGATAIGSGSLVSAVLAGAHRMAGTAQCRCRSYPALVRGST